MSSKKSSKKGATDSPAKAPAPSSSKSSKKSSKSSKQPSTPAKDVAPAAPPKEQVAEKPAAAPIRRARYDVAVLQALDKVTAETLRFEARVGAPVRWKGLVFTVSACERSAPDEPIEDAIAYVTIDAQPRAQPGRVTCSW